MKEFRTAYGPQNKVQLNCTDPSRARQSMKQECDINFILQKYKKTGLITHVAKHQGSYGEFDVIDFHEAMNAIRDAEEMFLELPADLRKKFHNDPGEFVEFTTNPDNRDTMEALGLIQPKKAQPGQQPPPPGDQDPATTIQTTKQDPKPE